jgi:excinuclease UvrABC nuclease subunit
LKQYYFNSEFTPDEVFVPADFEDRQLLEDFLSQRRGKRIEIKIPQRGVKRTFVDLVNQNAKLSFDQRFRVLNPSGNAISEGLASALGLETAPRRIECFDISNIQGTDSVASMVVWEDGKMKKSDYRKFIIKTVEGADDFQSIREVVLRRYKRLQDEGTPMPDLVLIDGGLGQLHAAASALEELDLPTQPLASIAKKEEILYVFGSEDEPVVLDKHSPVLHLIQMIRDETHRFAVTFHRQRRSKRTLVSAMTAIPGVGEKTSKLLLRKFGSVQSIEQQSLRHSPRKSHRVWPGRFTSIFTPLESDGFRMHQDLTKENRMRSNPTAPKSIDEYIADFPKNVQEILEQVRIAIKKLCPTQKKQLVIKYRLSLKGKYLVYFAAYKNISDFILRQEEQRNSRKSIS